MDLITQSAGNALANDPELYRLAEKFAALDEDHGATIRDCSKGRRLSPDQLRHMPTLIRLGLIVREGDGFTPSPNCWRIIAMMTVVMGRG